jgi:hypothetical protein
MSYEHSEPVMAPITAEDMARFHRNAPAALARRGGNFVGEQLGAAFEMLITGLVPIIGMLAYGWSANQLLVFLLVGAWTAILLDLFKLVLLYEGVKRFGATHYDDWHVWVVAQALREGKTEAARSHLKAKYQPEMGVVVDLLLGSVATVAILAAASGESWSGLRGLFADRSVLYGLAILVGYQIIFAAWEILRRVVAKDAGEVKVAVGMRGLGLFLLMFLVVMIRESAGDNGAVARGAMLTVNGLIVGLAVFNAVGQLGLRRETAWLKSYLREHPPSADSLSATPSSRATKRKRR